jgi:putative endonuclease
MSRTKGNIAEEKACLFLWDKGFSIIEQNFYSRFGELDIIATKDEVLHFVEVKSAEDYEKAVQNITPSKLSKLIKTSNIYMKKNGFDGDFVYDAVIITPNETQFLENITI